MPCNWETPLGIGFQFDVARVVYVGITPCGMETAWTYAAERKGTEVVGASYVELLAEWCCRTVAIGVEDACNKACGKRVARGCVVVAASLDIAFDELGLGGV